MPSGAIAIAVTGSILRVTSPQCSQPQGLYRRRTPQVSHPCPVLKPHRISSAVELCVWDGPMNTSQGGPTGLPSVRTTRLTCDVVRLGQVLTLALVNA